jgi:hypothetical protein
MNQAIMPAPTVDEPMDISAMMKPKGACHECGQMGHYKAECPRLVGKQKGPPKKKFFPGKGKKGAPRERQSRRRQLKQMINQLGHEIEQLPSSESEEGESESEGEEASESEATTRQDF